MRASLFVYVYFCSPPHIIIDCFILLKFASRQLEEEKNPPLSSQPTCFPAPGARWVVQIWWWYELASRNEVWARINDNTVRSCSDVSHPTWRPSAFYDLSQTMAISSDISAEVRSLSAKQFCGIVRLVTPGIVTHSPGSASARCFICFLMTCHFGLLFCDFCCRRAPNERDATAAVFAWPVAELLMGDYSPRLPVTSLSLYGDRDWIWGTVSVPWFMPESWWDSLMVDLGNLAVSTRSYKGREEKEGLVERSSSWRKRGDYSLKHLLSKNWLPLILPVCVPYNLPEN